jgi:mono/diheme cytochrome c family protein
VARGSERLPAARWDFGTEETTPLQSQGGVHRDVPGPRPPEYPDFEPGNTAVRLDGSGARLVVDDSGTGSPFDFGNGDAITLEAWVQVDDLRAGENVYVIGKGRTGAVGFAPDNQNWALRVREHRGQACVSFLFATSSASGVARSDAHWHRWTTSGGFTPGQNWHHIAVAYEFGNAASVRGWIDGQRQPGVWDMGGATAEAPVVDDDAIWIGSSRGGSAPNSFRGALDSIAVHRQALDDAVIKTRYRREGGEVVAKPTTETMPDLGELPSGRVLVTFHEGMPAHDRWLNVGESLPGESARCDAETFLLARLPQRYDAWGIREEWKGPVLTRLASDVTVAPGQHRFVMRVRGLSRLWVNGKVVAQARPLTGSPNGEEPITPVAKPPGPGLRGAEHRQQEVFGEAVIGAGGNARVVLETLVGGKAFKADPGELCVGVETVAGCSIVMLQPAGSSATPVPLTDHAIEAALARQEASMHALEDRTRRDAATSQDAFWARRHDAARSWARQHPAPPVPAGDAHPIDAFLTANIERARIASAQTPVGVAKQFYATVLPILRDQCFRCHGEKEKGGLRLNSRAAALRGGESEMPAVVPGNVAESELLRRIRTEDLSERMPPNGSGLAPEQIAALEDWVKAGASWPPAPLDPKEVESPPVINDAAFLRRVFLDTVGVPPDESNVRGFLADSAPDKRARFIDRLLADERWADHWLSYWQDVLAENPTLLNRSLNTTGPFRWFLYDALRDGKPLDRLVTELILLRGSPHEGGSAGFGIAADNDAPFAAKGQIIATAFLGIELQCARCHDSPYHSTTQRDLYALAALFERKPVTVPKTSRVPDAFFEKKGRESLIKVTMKPGEAVPPAWPFAAVTGSPDDPSLDALMMNPADPRERLAALVTAPWNTRFAQVVVNRVWRRFLGAGFVEPAHDWEGHTPSHPELLDWLAREFVTHDYDVKHLARLILTSRAYQREAVGRNLQAGPERRFFAAPDRRRFTAEQVVDTLYAAAGQRMDVEEITFDPDGRRPSSNRISLGRPRRAWMFANLANERDRPSLSLPRAQAVTDIMDAFGWSGARQNPRTDRETAPNVLQPGVLANSVASVWLTRVARGGALAEAAVDATSPEMLVDRVFLRYLGRLPSATERTPIATALAVGFETRVVPTAEVPAAVAPEPLPRVTWSNHLRPEATTIALELERRARLGPPPDPRLRPAWREVFEDVVWGIVNLREFVWVP